MPNFRPLLRSIVISIVLPALAIQVFAHLGVTLLYAIIASLVFPLAELMLSIRRRGSADVIALLSLVVLLASGIAALLGNDPRFALVRESALTSIAGLVFLVSLLRPRPLMFGLSRDSMPGATPQLWEERWRTRPRFRYVMRLFTAVWGCGLLCDSVARVLIALLLPPALTVIVSPVVAVVVFAALILFTLVYIRRIRQTNDPGGPVTTGVVA
ncbi:MAG TPA: VC0807 family protein [Candidatus Acidoferrales bacterium]|nr:VC0807 family protein [Candidatus Acidoferrales bacterium]